MAVYAEPNGMPKDVLLKFLEQRNVSADLTSREKAFLALKSPSEKDRGPFTWQYECANVLLWALGYVSALGTPTEYCTAQGVSAIVAPRSLVQLLEGAALRTSGEIFDQCDLMFRYHWAARNASLGGKVPPAGLIVPVCHYRHYALNWLVDSGTGWDDVDAST